MKAWNKLNCISLPSSSSWISSHFSLFVTHLAPNTKFIKFIADWLPSSPPALFFPEPRRSSALLQPRSAEKGGEQKTNKQLGSTSLYSVRFNFSIWSRIAKSQSPGLLPSSQPLSALQSTQELQPQDQVPSPCPEPLCSPPGTSALHSRDGARLQCNCEAAVLEKSSSHWARLCSCAELLFFFSAHSVFLSAFLRSQPEPASPCECCSN